MERGSLQARRERLTQLAPRIGPVAFARDRVLPVADVLEPLLPEGGLVRGSVVGCHGATAMSVAMAVVAEATSVGSWLAAVGIPALGLRAAHEVGIALERLVMVADPVDMDPKSWTNMVSALIDGFDLVMLRDAARLNSNAMRRLQSRVQARGAVLVVIGDPGPFICDLAFTGTGAVWEGLGHGAGRLHRRRITLAASGRRMPRARAIDVWLPGANGRIEAIVSAQIAPAGIAGGLQIAG